jgi:hypothetical protein
MNLARSASATVRCRLGKSFLIETRWLARTRSLLPAQLMPVRLGPSMSRISLAPSLLLHFCASRDADQALKWLARFYSPHSRLGVSAT